MTDRTLAVEGRTRAWLESNYKSALAQLGAGHESVWDAHGCPQRLTRYHFQEIQRKVRVFRWLDRLRFASFLDVGSGFDIYPNLVRARYGAAAYFSDFVHAMNMPYRGAAGGRLDHAVTLNAARLPFADGAFDVVLASEVLEHLVRPIEVIAELLRISRVGVILTSLEALSPNRRARWRSHWLVDVRRAHVERNFFLLSELDAVFGPSWHHENLLHDAVLPASAFRPDAEQRAAYASLRDVHALSTALSRATSIVDHWPGSMGILIVKTASDAVRSAPDPADETLNRWLIEQAALHERSTIELARAIRAGEDGGLPDPARPICSDLCARLRCADCLAAVHADGGGVRCAACGASFPVEFGVPVMYPTRPVGELVRPEDILERLCGGDAARRRAVQRLMRRLRRNEAPPGLLRRLSWHLLSTNG